MLMTNLHGFRDIEVPLSGALRRYDERTTARLSGNPDGPLVVALGGISANRFVCSDASGGDGWWPGLVGSGTAIDPSLFQILGLDFAADSTGSFAPSTACQARVLEAALNAAGAAAADLVIGASYGGMVALALAEHCPERVRHLAIISAPAEPHPASTAVRELQRRVVALGLECQRGDKGLAIARGLAMLTYRTREEFAERFAGGLPCDSALSVSESGAYLRARGDVYCQVMSPQRFISLSASIDRHQVDPSRIRQPALIVGATSDILVTPEQMQALAAGLPNAELHLLDCLYGHDMFLKEAEKIGQLLKPLLERL